MTEKSAVEALKDLGLTEYEARVYTALTRIKTGIASEIHQISGIPRSAVYGALEKLARRGIVEVQPTKPMRYKVVTPASTLEKLRSSFLLEARNALDALEEVYQEDADVAEEDNIWIDRGARNVHDKLLEVIRGSGQKIVILNSDVLDGLLSRYQIFDDLLPALVASAERGIRIRIAATSCSREKSLFRSIPGAEVRQSGGNACMGCLITSDSKHSIIVVCGQSGPTAFSAEGELLSSMYRYLSEAAWKDSTDSMDLIA